ncbi:hypothetical protein WJX73_004044 [Symbiochloris irregularis]|uniref:Methyltransferase type 11 domain-containing protein n=1 Tax=Symbiochloris irregularis TaxID=706552 RepID=A0AAW1PCK7_9CHLO
MNAKDESTRRARPEPADSTVLRQLWLGKVVSGRTAVERLPFVLFATASVYSAVYERSVAAKSRHTPLVQLLRGLVHLALYTKTTTGLVKTVRRGCTSSGPAQHRSSVRCMASAGTISREVLNRSQRVKVDPDDDRRFYDMPRFVNHVDDHFLQCVTALYRQRIPKEGAVLDMMSSHVSHLPKDNKYSKVVGHGMNALELAKNPQLSTFFVRNLNMDPSDWALASDSLDAVTCCVSVQYLQQPEKVFAEIYRVLKPGGVAIFSFSNRMFYTKAIRAWTDNTEYGRVSLVKQYFQCIEGFTPAEEVEEVDTSQEQPQGLAAFVSKLQGFSQNDPFYAIVSYKDFKPQSA